MLEYVVTWRGSKSRREQGIDFLPNEPVVVSDLSALNYFRTRTKWFDVEQRQKQVESKPSSKKKDGEKDGTENPGSKK